MTTSTLRSASSTPINTYRPEIDGLRAIAVIAVLVYHAFPKALRAGFIGVDIFFVISGFLITGIIAGKLAEGNFSLLDFYRHRVRRIFPALLTVLVACLVFGWLALLQDEYKQLGKHVAGGAGFIANLLLWQEVGYFDNKAETKPLLHLWSLGIEEQFYLVWPLVLAVVFKLRRNLLLWTSVLALASFALNVAMVKPDPSGTFYSPLTRFWELAIGGILALQVMRTSTTQSRGLWAGQTANHIKAALGFVLLIVALSTITKQSRFPGFWALLPVLGAYFIISAGPAAWFNRVVLASRPMVAIGLISYPLYLWHWPLLAFAHIVESETPAAPYRWAALGLSFVLAWLTYRLIEKPIRFGLWRAYVMSTLLGLMLVVGLIGLTIYKRDGLSFRPAAKIATLNTFTAAYRQDCRLLTNGPDKDDWCNFGLTPESPPNTVMIGDSFSNAASPILAAYAQSKPKHPFTFRQFGRGGCPSLIGYGPSDCAEIAALSERYIATTPSVHTVILANDWGQYYNGKDKENAWPNHSETKDSFVAATRANIEHYRAMGKRVIVFLTPPVGSDPRACVPRPMRLTSKDACNLSQKDAIEIKGNYPKEIVPMLAAMKVPTFDPFDFLCDGTTCKTTDGNKIFYLDGLHMSIFGGEYLAKKGHEALKTLFDNPPVGQPLQ
jgi:peptidoglycan/LPS O-acetylase OafA/YrhL